MNWTFRPMRRCIRMIITESYSDSASKQIRMPMERSVRSSILVGESARAVRRFHRHDVVIGIGGFIAQRPITDLQIDYVAFASVHEMVCIAGARLEACAHAGLQHRLARIRDERGRTF